MFEQWSPSRYEKLLAGADAASWQGSRLSGIARSLRISHDRRTAAEAEVVSTATGVVAPLVFFFTATLLRAAVRRGLRRIYFLARDGQIFMKVARELVQAWQLDIEVRYLYCSRESLLLPGFQEMGDFERNWATWGYLSTITTSEIERRLGLRPGQLLPFLNGEHLAAYRADAGRPVAKRDLPALHRALGNPALAELVRETTQPIFELTLAFLAQEGLCDGVPYALADTGWRGSSQYALSAVLQKGGVRPQEGLFGFYVGLNCDAHLFGNDTLEAFLFDWRTSNRDYTLYNFICFEMLFASEHGRTRGYRQEPGRIAPVLTEAPSEEHLTLVRTHHDYAVAYAQRVSGTLEFDAPDGGWTGVARRLSRAFICSPGPVQAEIYGQWPIASEMCEGDLQRMAPAMGVMQFIRCALGVERVKGYWPQASLVRSSCRLFCQAYNLFLRSGALDWYRRILLRY